MFKLRIKPAATKAVLIGSMCAISYLAVYIARNMLTATTPQIQDSNSFTAEQLGTLSSIYFITYACGQLINGYIGDRIKAKYMISLGLIFAGICNALFSAFSSVPLISYIAYGSSGFFLSMIYGPMTKVVAENTEPIYATRVSVSYTFSSLIGTPIAGLVAVIVAWRMAFWVSAGSLLTMGVITFLCFTILEKKQIIRFNTHSKSKIEKKGKLQTLIKRQILKFTVISMVTGIVRTAVVFWLPTYLSEYLMFFPNKATLLFTLCTAIISVTSFVAVFTYEILRRNMDLSILLYFIISAAAFLLLLFVNNPVLNIIILILAIMASNCADSLMWSRYCPSLYDTGLTSTATGYLDFISYMSAAAASSIFPHLKDYSFIGWKGLILIWFGFMVIGILVSIPKKKTNA